MSYLGTPPQSGFITTAKQRVTSSTNAYVDLDHAISSIADVIVFVNFVKQDTTNLTLTTSTRITLGATLVSSDIVEIHYLGKAVNTQTPSAGTVTSDMLAGSIANSKLANSSITLNGSAVSLGGSATISSEQNKPAFQSYLGADQSAANTSYTVVAFNGEKFDEGGCYNNTGSTVTLNSISTPAYSFAPNVAGKYYFYAQIRSDAWTSNGLAAVLKKNNSDFIYGYNTNGESRDNGYTSTWVFGADEANGTSDTYKVVVWHNNGSSQNINGYGSGGLEWGSTHFGGFLITT